MATILVVLVGAVVVGLGARALRDAKRLVPDPSPLRSALATANESAVSTALRALLPDEEDAELVTRALVTGSSRAAAVAVVNAHLGDVERSLGRGESLMRVLPRLGIGMGLFGVVLAISTGHSEGAARWIEPLEALIAGLGFGAAGLELARRTLATEASARAAWDDIARLLAERLEDRSGGVVRSARNPRSRALRPR